MVNVCVAWNTTPVRRIEDLRAKQWTVGGTAARSPSVQMANTFISLAAANFRVVKGYSGTMPMILAVERGELDIACGIGWDAVRSSSADYLTAGKIVPVMQLGYERHPDFKGVTFIYDVILDQKMKDALDLLTIRLNIGRAFAAPPGIPGDRLQALRHAFWKAMNDPALRAEADKALIEISPSEGENVQSAITRLISTPKDVVDLANRIVDNTLKTEWPAR
jgi:tripartite-type tricarboxylate transporter receptor subunit TctC